MPIVRLRRFEQSRLRDGRFTDRSESCRDLEPNRIAARLHCHGSDGHARPLIYDVIKVFDWAGCVLMSMLFGRTEDDSRARPSSIHSEFKLMLWPSLLSFVTYFPLFPSAALSFFHVSLYLTLFLPMNFITVRVSTGNVSARTWRCIYACPRIILGRFPNAYTCILAPLTMRSLSKRPEVTDRARSREEYLEERRR